LRIRTRLYAAIVVTVIGFGLLVGVAVWALNRTGDQFDRVERASDARALALQLKYDVVDLNGWQTAYGYDSGRSRTTFLTTVDRFRVTLGTAKRAFPDSADRRLLAEVENAFGDYMQLDAEAWAALQMGREARVKRILLGPEITNFSRASRAADQLAQVEAAGAEAERRRFEDARTDALRFLLGASLVAGLSVFILLVTATDLARAADRADRE
jgi:methyl-accepting chemotaxis protein